MRLDQADNISGNPVVDWLIESIFAQQGAGLSEDNKVKATARSGTKRLSNPNPAGADDFSDFNR